MRVTGFLPRYQEGTMAQRLEVRKRECKTCKTVIETTAKDMIAHAKECDKS